MKFRCEACGQKYSVADEKVAGKTLKIRCRKCSHVMRVRGAVTGATPPRKAGEAKADRPAARGAKGAKGSKRTPRTTSSGGGKARAKARGGRRRSGSSKGKSAPPPAPPEALAEPEERWYAVIAGQQEGPMDLAGLREAVVTGRIHAGTYVWSETLDDWRPISAVARLQPLLEELPPAPPPKKNSAAGTMQMRADEIAAAEAAARAAALREAEEEGEGASRESQEASLLAAIEEAARAAGTSEAVPEDTPEDTSDATQIGAPALEDAPGGAAGGGTDAGSAAEASEVGGVADPFAEALRESAEADPFAAVPDRSDPDEAPRETTQMFIIASGVNKRRSPLRIAAAILGFAGFIGGMGYLLSMTGVDLGGLVPIHHKDSGASRSWEGGAVDPERARQLREELLGKNKTAMATEQPGVAGAATRRDRPRDPVSDQPEVQAKTRQVVALSDEEKAAVAALYQERGHTVKIRVKAEAEEEGVDSAESPIEPEVVAKKIGDNQRAFQGCVQQELRRNPGFKGGRVVLTITVLPSGIVKSASLDDRTLNLSDVGVCIRRAAKRIIFPSFGGEEGVDFEIPLVLSTGY